ncbi:MAG: hypothetical protein AB8G23_21525 [Myxococcota bacterium]
MTAEVEEALARARKHLRAATSEGLEAASALLDAALHTTGMDDSDPRSFAGELRTSLDDLQSALAKEGALRFPTALAEPLIAALDAEIARWEERSANDPSSRPVLRAFLALREFLWEMGIRPDLATPATESENPSHTEPNRQHPGSPEPDHATKPSAASGSRRRPRERVQRFEVE